MKLKIHIILFIVALVFGLLPPRIIYAQKFTTGDISYNNFFYSDTSVNDSILQASLRVLFCDNNFEKLKVLESTDDTAYYNEITHWVMFTRPNRAWYEIGLQELKKKDRYYLLKCTIQYRDTQRDAVEFVGIITLPFSVTESGSIIFKNYFNLFSRRTEFDKQDGTIYTTHANAHNLSKIKQYTTGVSAKYGIPLTRKELYYIYYGEEVNPYKAIGMEYYAEGFLGRMLGWGNTLLLFDMQAGGCYKHELTHYVNEEILISHFFNEGLASYLGGSSVTCDNKCDYAKLLQVLQQTNTDSVFNRILDMRYRDRIPYGMYYYPLGSFTMHLLSQKYGDGFMKQPKVAAILNSTSKNDIAAFIINEFKANGEARLYYIQELRKFLN